VLSTSLPLHRAYVFGGASRVAVSIALAVSVPLAGLQAVAESPSPPSLRGLGVPSYIKLIRPVGTGR
jgi:hypothetical protein